VHPGQRCRAASALNAAGSRVWGQSNFASADEIVLQHAELLHIISACRKRNNGGQSNKRWLASTNANKVKRVRVPPFSPAKSARSSSACRRQQELHHPQPLDTS